MLSAIVGRKVFRQGTVSQAKMEASEVPRDRCAHETADNEQRDSLVPEDECQGLANILRLSARTLYEATDNNRNNKACISEHEQQNIRGEFF